VLLGVSLTAGVHMTQYVTQLAQSAQVRHLQSYNAFGEISEEYDDSTAQNMQAMVRHLGTRQSDEFWCTYDAANRFTMTKGSLIGTRGRCQH
jgi:hypothetical protein